MAGSMNPGVLEDPESKNLLSNGLCCLPLGVHLKYFSDQVYAMPCFSYCPALHNITGSQRALAKQWHWILNNGGFFAAVKPRGKSARDDQPQPNRAAPLRGISYVRVLFHIESMIADVPSRFLRWWIACCFPGAWFKGFLSFGISQHG